jgi:histone H1/5
MSDSAVASPVTAEKPASPPKKATKVAAAAKSKKPKAPKTHPPVADIVFAAVKTLKERGGSSLQAIKKAAYNKVDVEKLASFFQIDSGHKERICTEEGESSESSQAKEGRI